MESNRVPRFKRIIEFGLSNNNTIYIQNLVTKNQWVLESDEIILSFIKLIDNNNTISDIKKKLSEKYNKDFSEDVDIFLDFFIENKIIEFNQVVIPEKLSRYQDQINFLNHFLKKINL